MTDHLTLNQALLIVISYVAGGIPFGLWLGRWCCHVDIREHGSCNIGASNAWRVLGWRVGLPVFALDLAKGLVPVLIARHLAIAPHTLTRYETPSSTGRTVAGDWTIVGAGIASVLGHNFSPFIGFKGGKGVATSLGVAIGMSWKAGLAGFVTWVIVLGLTRYISLASMIGVPVGSAMIWLENNFTLPFAVFAVLATVSVFVKHKANIQRLVNHSEPKVSLRK